MFENHHDPAPMRVGYVLKQYPRLSETFILNEIIGLEENDVDVSIFSLRHSTEGRFHPAIAAVRGTVYYVADPDKAAFLDALRALPHLRAERLPAVFEFLDRIPQERRSRIVLQAIDIANATLRLHIDHLHAHFLTVAAQTVHLVHLLTGLPYTVTAHAKDIYRHSVDWDLARQIAARASAIVTVCDFNQLYLSQRLDLPDCNIVRIYNGLGPQEPPSPVQARTRGLVLGVGRLVEKKGFDLMLDAIAPLSAARPEMHGVIIGDGDQRVPLRKQAARLGIADRVTFLGALPQDRVSTWLRRAELMIAPCRIGTDGNQDALPTVLLEALGAGLPVVTTPVAGITEIIDDGVEGLIVPCDDPAALSRATASLLDDHNTRAAMAAAGPVKLEQRFNRAETVRELIDAFGAKEPVA